VVSNLMEKLITLLVNVRQAQKRFPRTNTLAYVASSSMTNQKKFYNTEDWASGSILWPVL
jgi:hypothetical protein